MGWNHQLAAPLIFIRQVFFLPLLFAWKHGMEKNPLQQYVQELNTFKITPSFFSRYEVG